MKGFQFKMELEAMKWRMSAYALRRMELKNWETDFLETPALQETENYFLVN